MKYKIYAQIGNPEDWDWEQVDCVNNYKEARTLANEGARVFIGNKEVFFLNKENKKNIEIANKGYRP